MTRQKKSRKIGSIGTRKQETRPADTKQPRSNKKPKGQPSGNRNSLIEENVVSTPQNQDKNTNPKLGSKKPISLLPQDKPTVKEHKKIDHSKSKPSAKLTKAEPEELNPKKKLNNIEAEERLIALVERVQDGELLSGKEAKDFNKQMERLDELLEILGIDPDSDEEEESNELDALENLGASEWDDLLKDEK